MENETSDAKVPIIERHKEIDLIQSCINRMAQNSFQVKGWTVALYELNFKEFESKESLKGTAIWETAFSKTLKWFYGIPTVISIAYLVVQLIQYCPCKGV